MTSSEMLQVPSSSLKLLCNNVALIIYGVCKIGNDEENNLAVEMMANFSHCKERIHTIFHFFLFDMFLIAN